MEFGPLDCVVPPCYVTTTWIVDAFDVEGAIEALNELVKTAYPFLLGRLVRDARGRWRVDPPYRGDVSVERVEEECVYIDVTRQPFSEWSPNNLVVFFNATPDPNSGEVPSPIIHVRIVRMQGHVALTVYAHHNVCDGRAFFRLLIAEWKRRVVEGTHWIAPKFSGIASVWESKGDITVNPDLGLSLIRPTYTFPYPAMHTLRLCFAAEAMKADCDGTLLGLSRNDCVCAALWGAMTHCRGIEGESSIVVAVDVRKRTHAENATFGNAILNAEARGTRISSKPLHGLAQLVRAAVAELTTDRIKKTIQWIESVPDASTIVSPGQRVALSNSLLVSNWSQFPLLSASPFPHPIFAGPVMPSVFPGMDGVAVLCGEEGTKDLTAFVGIETAKAEAFCQHPLIKKYARFL